VGPVSQCLSKVLTGGDQSSESGFTGLSDFQDYGHTQRHLLNLDNP
jgi:hypothetical protein